ncbi:MAG: AEC family transporter [Caldilineales bacterium]|nr:AEC family transporter [Caldilineales bacterium]
MLASLGQVLLDVLAPIVVVTAVGYLLQSRLHLDIRSISRIIFYVLAPCLIYTNLVKLEFDPGTVGRLLVFSAGLMAVMAFFAYITARKWGYKGALGSAFLVATILLNNGNYGLPLNLFAFGETGFGYALIIFMFNSLVGSTTAIFLLAHCHDDVPARVALKQTLGAPVIWAMTLGMLSRVTGIAPSGTMMDMIEMMGRSAIPVFLLVLGMTLTTTRIRLGRNAITRATSLRMLGGPVIGLVLAALLGLSGIAYSVAVMQASMPTAVNSIVLSNEFEAAPDFMAGAVFLTTIVSVVTIPILLMFLK